MQDRAVAVIPAGERMEAAAGALAAWRAAPHDPGATAAAWQLFTHMGEADEVERFERRLAETGDAVAVVGLANALRRAGRALRAERLYRQALERFPEVSFTLSRLGCLCAELNRLEEADRFFRAAAARHGGRDTVTRTDPAFLASLRAGPPPAGIAGTLIEGAAVRGKPLIVYVACDPVYFRRFAGPMLRSVAEDSGLDAAICLHVVNPDPETARAMEAEAAAYGAERFVLVRERADLAPLGAQAKTHFACSRFLFLPELLARYGRPVLMLDVDLLVLRDLAPLLATSAAADLGAMTNALKRLDIWSLVYADVLHVRPTPAAAAFLDLAARYVRHFLKPGTAHWFLDQAALAGVVLAGFADRPPPRIVWYPTDVHSSELVFDAAGNYWCDEHACFYSVRVSGGGQTGVHRLKRRAGTAPDLAALRASAAPD